MSEKTKLTRGPDKTVTWIWLEDNQLKIEYYDFSEDAQRFFGNDIAYTLSVTDMDKLYSTTGQDESSLVQWTMKNFKSYFDVKKWLEENGIDFNVETESWA